jgi:dienelactone hydrolase
VHASWLARRGAMHSVDAAAARAYAGLIIDPTPLARQGTTPMLRLTYLASLVLALTAAAVLSEDKDPTRVLNDELPKDSRQGKPRTLNDKDFFLKVPGSKAAWEQRRQQVREQVLVATGLWPLPEKTPLKAVIHGKIDREGYTVEKVYFASYPGHYVSGNLYRPKGKTGKLPAILSPHGHWQNGRFFENSDDKVAEQITQNAETTENGARYPLQARCAQLARMGCVVFHYDMVGRADSKDIGHATGFADADGELRLQSAMGLQTWNSVRALDFLLSLPDVDPKRIGVTGASGGGTQTFILCAIDDRPAAAFPAVMVSTEMQGGCVCENCSYLRQGTGNIELAGLFAPKPLGMTGANDWTLNIEKKGLPELKALYKLYGAEDKVMAKCLPQFDHNYNQVSREVMYNFFNKHLELGHKGPIKEQPFEPVPPKELSVYDDDHPRPTDRLNVGRLRQQMAEASDKQILALRPKDAESLKEYRRVLGTALRVMIHEGLTERADIPVNRLAGKGESNGTVVVWIHPDGKRSLMRDGKPVPAAQRILDANCVILAPDVFWTGEAQGVVVQVRPDAKRLEAHKVSTGDVRQAVHAFAVPVGDMQFVASKKQAPQMMKKVGELKLRGKDDTAVLIKDVADVATNDRLPVNEDYAGFTFGYNRPMLANRVRDILAVVRTAKEDIKGAKRVYLVGFGEAGPWVALARGLCGDAVSRTAVDFNQFQFLKVRRVTDDMMLPGALKYGGLAALTSLAAPGELYVHNMRGTGSGQWLKAAYEAAGKPDRLERSGPMVSDDKVVEWLLR